MRQTAKVLSHPRNNSGKTTDSKPETAVTVFTAGNVSFMSKRYTLREGVIVKSPAPLLYTGTGETRQLPGGLGDLPGVLAGLERNQVLCLGVPREAPPGAYPVTTSGGSADGITRTKENYIWPSSPIVLLDLDADAGWRGSPVTLEEVYPILCDLLGVEGFGAVIYPSSSAGVHIKDTDGGAGGGACGPISIHCYIQLAEDRLIPILQDVIRTRSWATGRGYVKLSAAGTMLYRAVFDDSVFDPSRLVYEAPPVLGDGLGRHVFPPVIIPGGYVHVIPPVTPGDLAAAAEAMREAREAMETRAAEVREAYELGVVSRLLERNPEMEPDEAALAASRLVERRVLPLDFELALSRTETITVRDLLADAVKYDGRALPDPHEGVDYGITTAKFYANGLVRGGVGEPVINSFAHGITLTYWFEQDCADEFDIVPDEDTLARDARLPAGLAVFSRDDLLSRYVYLREDDKFYDLMSRSVLSASAVNTTHKHLFKGTKNSPLAVSILADSGEKQIVEGLMWYPSHERMLEHEGKTFVNTFTPPFIERIPGDVSLWLELCHYIYGDHADLVLDHMAYTLQYPARKIRWQVLCLGKPRTGKSLTIRPLIRILGPQCGVIDSDSIDAGWGDIWTKRKMLVLEEVFKEGDKRFFNQIKPKLSNDDFELLNIKQQGQILQKNLYSIYMFTNHVNAVHMDASERKLLVVEAPDIGFGIVKCDELFLATDHGHLPNHVYDHLMSRDVTNFPANALPVVTKAMLKMCAMGKTGIEMVLECLLNDEPRFMGEFVNSVDLQTEMGNMCAYKVGYSSLATLMLSRGFIKVRGMRKVNKVVRVTPHFWTKNKDVVCLSPADLYHILAEGDADL